MGPFRGFRQQLKKLFKSSVPDTILRKPFENMEEFYTIHEELGDGTYAVTYRCTENSTKKSYACKKISKKKVTSEADIEKIKREIEIMQLLSGRPNIVGFKSVHEDEQFVHLVMDLCKGGDLAAYIRDNGRFSESDAAKICKQIVEAVHACHSIGVIHRDVKPQNLLFSTSDRNALLKLADFGVSVFIRRGRYERAIIGTAPYIAPEVIDRQRYGKAADIWSAGVILYYLLSGLLPFGGVPGPMMDQAILEGHIDLVRDPWPSITDPAKDLVCKMLTHYPEERITSTQVLEHPWIIQYGGKRRRSIMRKLSELIKIRLLCSV